MVGVQYGHVYLKVEPLERGEGLSLEPNCWGAIPKDIPAVEKVLKRREWCIAGYPLVDFQVTLFDGSFLSDSSEMAFKMAAIEAMRAAQTAADTFLSEPIMS